MPVHTGALGNLFALQASPHHKNSIWRRLVPYVVIAAVGAAVALLYRNLRQYDLLDLVSSIAAISFGDFAIAIGWAAASYLCLTGFDYLALRYVKRDLPYTLVAFTSFVALSIGHNLGIAFLSSGAIRYRLYSRAGLGADDIAKVIAFCGVTVGLGLSTLGGIALLLQKETAAQLLAIPTSFVAPLSAISLAIPTVYVLAALMIRRQLRIRSFVLEMPDVKLALLQILVGSVNFAFVAACLHSSIAAFSDVPYPTVTAVYVIANVAGLISHIPGGLGVIEGVVLYLLPDRQLLAAVLVFRFVYFLVPLALGSALFAISEIRLGGKGRASPNAKSPKAPVNP